MFSNLIVGVVTKKYVSVLSVDWLSTPTCQRCVCILIGSLRNWAGVRSRQRLNRFPVRGPPSLIRLGGAYVWFFRRSTMAKLERSYVNAIRTRVDHVCSVLSTEPTDGGT